MAVVVDQVDEFLPVANGTERAKREEEEEATTGTAVKEEANPFGIGPIKQPGAARRGAERTRNPESLYIRIDNLYSLRLLLGQPTTFSFLSLSFSFFFCFPFCCPFARARAPSLLLTLRLYFNLKQVAFALKKRLSILENNIVVDLVAIGLLLLLLASSFPFVDPLISLSAFFLSLILAVFVLVISDSVVFARLFCF